MNVKRLPIIRHVRAIVAAVRVEQHYRAWAKLGFTAAHRDSDEAVIRAIWRGEA